MRKSAVLSTALRISAKKRMMTTIIRFSDFIDCFFSCIKIMVYTRELASGVIKCLNRVSPDYLRELRTNLSLNQQRPNIRLLSLLCLTITVANQCLTQNFVSGAVYAAKNAPLKQSKWLKWMEKRSLRFTWINVYSATIVLIFALKRP